MPEIDIRASDWLELETGLPDGERIFAIGDVHGMTDQFRNLLDAYEFEIKAGRTESAKLVILGDLIDRGSDSLGSLEEAVACAGRRFGSVEYLMGNHEQMLKRTLRGESWEDLDLWKSNGGRVIYEKFKEEWEGGFDWEIEKLARNLAEYLGPEKTRYLEGLRPRHDEGDLLFVHAGINPHISLEEHFSQPWDLLSESHWSWIRYPFLNRPVPFPGLTVVHGHTPVRRRQPGMGRDDLFGPHLEDDGKINLDGGSFASGCVAGAEFEAGRYRITVAVGEEPR